MARRYRSSLLRLCRRGGRRRFGRMILQLLQRVAKWMENPTHPVAKPPSFSTLGSRIRLRTRDGVSFSVEHCCQRVVARPRSPSRRRGRRPGSGGSHRYGMCGYRCGIARASGGEFLAVRRRSGGVWVGLESARGGAVGVELGGSAGRMVRGGLRGLRSGRGLELCLLVGACWIF